MSAKRIVAVAGLTVRRTIKSRVALAALLLLAVVIVGLPFTIKGDGTLAGQVRVLLHYTLGTAMTVAGAITLWIASGSVSNEIETRTAHMLLVKPVRRWEVWAGKWLGLLGFNAGVVALSGIAVYGFLVLNLRNHAGSVAEMAAVREGILVARRPYRPAPEDLSADVEARFAWLQQQGAVSQGTCPVELRRELEKEILMRRAAVLPSESRAWRVDLSSARFRDTGRLQLRFRLAASVLVWLPVSGTWEISPPDGRPFATFPVENCSGGNHVIDLPNDLLRDPGAWTVRFVNGRKGQSGAAVFDMESPLEVLVSNGSFEANMLRALLIALSCLALLAALGLGTSALFSSPVSGFVACAILVMAFSSHFFSFASQDPHADDHHSCEHEQKAPSVLLVASQHLARTLDVIVAPAMGHGAFSKLADGVLVSWQQVGRASGVLMIVYPAVIGLLACVCLNRREAALPR